MTDTCPICLRPLTESSSDDHHLIPKAFKGTETVCLHKICHQKIHSCITERELLHYYNTVERLIEHEEIRKFVNWVKNKHPDFHDVSVDSKTRNMKRRR